MLILIIKTDWEQLVKKVRGKGYTSIKAFGLNRGAISGDGLLEERIALLKKLEHDYCELMENIEIAETDSNRKIHLNKLSKFIIQIKKNIDGEKEKYIAFRKAFLSSKKEELKNKYGIIINI